MDIVVDGLLTEYAALECSYVVDWLDTCIIVNSQLLFLTSHFNSAFFSLFIIQDFPLALASSDVCAECGGSCMSGQLLQCQICGTRQRHWHCFPQADDGAWVCDGCCKVSEQEINMMRN